MALNKTTLSLYGLVAAALLIAAGAAAGPFGKDAFDALLPSWSSTVPDFHGRHLEAKVGCASCHRGTSTSRWASERLIPKMSDCAPCHPEAAKSSAAAMSPSCRMCHTRLGAAPRPSPARIPRPNIRFSHKAHADLECSACHPVSAGEKANPQEARSRDVPRMQQCFDCHREGGASVDCRTCHIVYPDGRMITRWGEVSLTPPEWLFGPSHGETWAGSHAEAAGTSSGRCGACHTEKQCQDCHTGAVRPRQIHPADWIRMHGVKTRIDNPRCLGCHKAQSFCITCHRRAGVAPDSPAAALTPGGPGRFHKGMTTRQICRRAKRDISGCVSCHSESSCSSCHAFLNPHPLGWRRKCGHLARKNPKSCGKCHTGPVLNLCD